ncbi:MAG TPA: NHL repeat-containing protein [Armatimonadota bacterium]|nr:NHL repeat-containing protein [Armatimonadota bacterium]
MLFDNRGAPPSVRLLALAGVVALAGCGLGGDSLTESESGSVGRVVVRVKWPEAPSSTRVIPDAARSISLYIIYADATRTAGNIDYPETEKVFDPVRAGAATLQATAYASAAHRDPWLARGEANVSIKPNIDGITYASVILSEPETDRRAYDVADVRWGYYGTGAGEFQAPCKLAADGDLTVYVLDTQQSKIAQYDLSSGDPVLSREIGGGQGVSLGQLSYPYDIAVHPETHDIWVADTGNNRIQVFSRGGEYQAGCPSSPWDPMVFISPRSIDIDPFGTVFVLDGPAVDSSTGLAAYRIVQVNAKFRDISRQLIPVGSGEGQLKDPQGMAVDRYGNCFVADTGNKRIVKFGRAGSLRTQWTYTFACGSVVDEMLANDVDVDDAGNVCVIGSTRDRSLFKFDNSGNLVSYHDVSMKQMEALFGHMSNVKLATGIAVTPLGRVYVFDGYPVDLSNPTSGLFGNGAVMRLDPEASDFVTCLPASRACTIRVVPSGDE